jgi:hypothetical protein
MQRCTTDTPGGASILLTKSLPFDQSPEQPGKEAAWILGHGLSLIEPFTLDLHIGLRAVDEPFWKDSDLVQHPTWHVRRADVAPEVRPAFQAVSGHQDRIVERIDTATLEAVLDEALSQPAPPDSLVTFDHFIVKNLRARVLRAELAQAQTMTVWRGRFDYDVPIVHDARGAWIEEYPDDLDPPLELHVYNSDGSVRAELWIGWSLWKEEGSAEHTAVVGFARGLMTRGYLLKSADSEFRNTLT